MEIKNIVLLVIFILGVVYMQFIQAHSVDDLINKYAEARGGKAKLNSIISLCMEGSRKMMGAEVGIKITKVQGELYRIDFEFAGNKGYTIVTPSAGWSFIPVRSKNADAIPEHLLKVMQTDMDIAGPLINYAAKGYKAELEGKEDMGGREAYKIKLTSGAGKEIIFLLDTKTYLIIQTKQMRIATDEHGNEKEVITNYADYKPVDGILFPHTITNPADGPGAGSVTFSKIELNKNIEEDQYKLPVS